MTVCAALFYRARQFFAALQSDVSDTELQLVTDMLTAAEWELFMAMPLYDRRHCLDVFYTLRKANYNDPLLLRAALIHDCGKVDDDGTPMPLLWYLIVTLLKRIPTLYRMAAASGCGPLRYVRIYAEHASRGSRMAQAAGCPHEMVVTLRHYHDSAPQGYAALLQWADERN